MEGKEQINPKPWIEVIIRSNRFPQRGTVMDFAAPKTVDGVPEVKIIAADMLHQGLNIGKQD